MNNKKQKKYGGIITALSGTVIVGLGTITGLINEDNLISVISAVGGLILIVLGAILLELESQTELFIAYVDEFVKPKQKTKKKKEKKL